MKKNCLIMAVLIVLVFAIASCAKPTEVNRELNNTEVTEATAETQNTAEPTEQPTPEPEPESTPDIDPFSKMQISHDEMNTLIHYWTINEINVTQQGSLDSLSVRTKTGILNLNYTFTSDNSADDIKSLYLDVIDGQWEDSEYSDPILQGKSSSDESVLCQVSEMGLKNELFVFIGSKNEQNSDDYMTFFDNKWPIGLVPLHEIMADTGLKELNISYPELSITYTKGYSIIVSADEIIEYYRNVLSGFDNFMVVENYDESKAIACSSNGVEVSISYSEFSESVIVSYSVGMLEQ